MRNKFKSVFSIILAFMLTVMCFTGTVCAADAKAVLTFKVSEDGYAVVSDCAETAEGVVSIPTSVKIKSKTYQVKYIGDKAFDKCYHITKINIPEGVTAIGNYAFRNCIKLKDVFIPESLVRCEFDAFDGCDKLTVHCYTANYQFISLGGIYVNIDVDVIDEQENTVDNEETEEDDLAQYGFIGVFIRALKNLIRNILNYFDVQDDEFSIDDLPFDLPFDIPMENDSIFDIDL